MVKTPRMSSSEVVIAATSVFGSIEAATAPYSDSSARSALARGAATPSLSVAPALTAARRTSDAHPPPASALNRDSVKRQTGEMRHVDWRVLSSEARQQLLPGLERMVRRRLEEK